MLIAMLVDEDKWLWAMSNSAKAMEFYEFLKEALSDMCWRSYIKVCDAKWSK